MVHTMSLGICIAKPRRATKYIDLIIMVFRRIEIWINDRKFSRFTVRFTLDIYACTEVRDNRVHASNGP